MEVIIFISLFLLYFIIGIKFLIKRNTFSFLLVTVMLPLTSSLTVLHTRYQISVYYSFAFVLVIYYFFESLAKTRVSKNVVIAFASTISFIIFYLLLYLVFDINNSDFSDLLKDIKPLLFLFIGFVFLDLFRFYQLDWGGPVAKKIVKYNCIASILWFLVLNKTSIVATISDDPYYLINGSRFSSIGTVFVVFYYIAGLASKRKFDIYDILYISIPVLLAGNRTTIFLMAVLYVINMMLSSKNIVLFLKRIILFIFGIFISILIIFNLNGDLRSRMFSMFNIDIIKDQLFNHRFTPFFYEVSNFEWFNHIIGMGMGKTIFIPWFVYRDNIDDFNIYMDNIYMTLYIKYGLLMILPLLAFASFVDNTNTNKRFKTLILIYFSIIGLTTSFLYQSGFLFSLIALGSFGFVRRNG